MSGQSLSVRDALPSDEPFLESTLRDILYWRDDREPPPVERLRREEEFTRRRAEWGRRGDTALIGEVSGVAVCAGWYRLWSPRERMDGFFDARVPVAMLAVRKDCRSVGHGQALLDALVERALDAGAPGLSASVAVDNPALQWCERRGFLQVAMARGAWTVMLDAPIARLRRGERAQP